MFDLNWPLDVHSNLLCSVSLNVIKQLLKGKCYYAIDKGVLYLYQWIRSLKWCYSGFVLDDVIQEKKLLKTGDYLIEKVFTFYQPQYNRGFFRYTFKKNLP